MPKCIITADAALVCLLFVSSASKCVQHVHNVSNGVLFLMHIRDTCTIILKKLLSVMSCSSHVFLEKSVCFLGSKHDVAAHV